MNKDQIDAFNIFWTELTAQCKVNFPEVIDVLELEASITNRVMSRELVANQRASLIKSMNAVIQLMQVVNLEDQLWAKAIVFRWTWDWELKQEKGTKIKYE